MTNPMVLECVFLFTLLKLCYHVQIYTFYNIILWEDKSLSMITEHSYFQFAGNLTHIWYIDM